MGPREVHVLAMDGTLLCKARSLRLLDDGGDLVVNMTISAIDVEIVEFDRGAIDTKALVPDS